MGEGAVKGGDRALGLDLRTLYTRYVEHDAESYLQIVSAGCELDFEPWGPGLGGITGICVSTCSSPAKRKTSLKRRLLVVLFQCSKPMAVR